MRTIKPILIVSLAALLLLPLAGCKRDTRTRVFLPAYKRLIRTDTEVTALQARLTERETELLLADNDPARLEAVLALLLEVDDWKDEVTYKLANRYRRPYHRKAMDRLWNAYLDLYPDDYEWVKGYRELR